MAKQQHGFDDDETLKNVVSMLLFTMRGYIRNNAILTCFHAVTHQEEHSCNDSHIPIMTHTVTTN